MISSRLSNRGFYGWFVLGGALSMLISMVGNVVVSYSVFLPQMADDMGWSRSALSGPFSLFWIVTGFLGPLVGSTVVRFGPRKNIILGNIVMIIGAVLMSRVTEVWQIYLVYSLIMGSGQAFGSFIAANGMMTNWFHRRRNLAITLLSACGGIGGLIFPPLITLFMGQFGWRDAWLAVAVTHTILGLVIPFLLVRNSPEELGQTPDGDPPITAENPGTIKRVKLSTFQTDIDWETRRVIKTRSFWMIMLFSASIMFTVNFISLHQVAYLQDLGFSAMTAATGIGMFNAINIVGQLSSGLLASKVTNRFIAIFSIIGAAGGLVILMKVNSMPLIYTQAVITGLCCGGVQVLTPIMLVSYYGRKNYARILGWVTPVMTLFSSGSPLLAGFIYDSTGSYDTVFIITLAVLAIGLFCAFLAKPPVLKEP